jgi:hypothetical protein
MPKVYGFRQNMAQGYIIYVFFLIKIWKRTFNYFIKKRYSIILFPFKNLLSYLLLNSINSCLLQIDKSISIL